MDLWKCRKRAFGAIGRLSPNFLTQDGVVPRSRLPEIMRFIQGASKKYGLRIPNVFHAGDGNIHPLILYDERQPDQVRLERPQQPSQRLWRIAAVGQPRRTEGETNQRRVERRRGGVDGKGWKCDRPHEGSRKHPRENDQRLGRRPKHGQPSPWRPHAPSIMPQVDESVLSRA